MERNRKRSLKPQKIHFKKWHALTGMKFRSNWYSKKILWSAKSSAERCPVVHSNRLHRSLWRAGSTDLRRTSPRKGAFRSVSPFFCEGVGWSQKSSKIEFKQNCGFAPNDLFLGGVVSSRILRLDVRMLESPLGVMGEKCCRASRDSRGCGRRVARHYWDRQPHSSY